MSLMQSAAHRLDLYLQEFQEFLDFLGILTFYRNFQEL
jgi:hypothetical protein